MTTTTVIGTTTIALSDRTSAVGECVRWDQETATKTREVQTVSCEATHLFEMLGMTLVPEPWTNGPYPPVPELDRMIEAACRGLADQYLRRPVDPHGFVNFRAIHPLEQGWLKGDRELACGLVRGVIDRSDAMALTNNLELETVGSIRTSDQRFPWKVGDCLTKEFRTFRVPCDEPHTYEFVGWGEFPTQSAPPDGNDPVYSKTCAALANTYQPETAPSIVVLGQTVSPESWADGALSFGCYLGSADKDPDGLPIKRVGSVRAVTV